MLAVLFRPHCINLLPSATMISNVQVSSTVYINSVYCGFHVWFHCLSPVHCGTRRDISMLSKALKSAHVCKSSWPNFFCFESLLFVRYIILRHMSEGLLEIPRPAFETGLFSDSWSNSLVIGIYHAVSARKHVLMSTPYPIIFIRQSTV